MAIVYMILVVAGLVMIAAGFYGAFVYKGKKYINTLLSVLMPLGLVVALLGIVLTVLPDFFKDVQW